MKESNKLLYLVEEGVQLVIVLTLKDIYFSQAGIGSLPMWHHSVHWW